MVVDEPRPDDTQTTTPTTASSTAEQAADDTARQTTPAPSESVSVAPPQEEVVAPAAAAKRPVGRPAATPPSAATSSPAATTTQRTEAADDAHPVVLSISGLVKQFGDTVAVDGVDLEVRRGSFYGIVGPNGAGKTTTLSMVTGLLRPDAGSITVQGVDVWQDPAEAKRAIGVLPDRLRLFDRLTGSQLLYYSGVLRGLDPATVKSRTADLARAFGLDDALGRLVSDYSAGMTKKIALAAALIHSPRLLILDEPFESVDPVSAANVIEILQRYVANGGTVVLSSHGMDFIQRVCDHVAIIVQGKVLAAGSVDEVRGTGTLEERFVELAGGRKSAEGMEWLHSFSD
nr:ABC transporter ATP-binding protein [Plantibacter cousiniae]